MKNHLMKEDLLSTPKLNAESLFLFIFYVTLAQILLITGSGYVKITSKITNDGVHKKEIKRGQTFSIIMKKNHLSFSCQIRKSNHTLFCIQDISRIS